MRDTTPTDLLIHKHLDGIASAKELAELDLLVATSPEAAESFVRAARTDSALEDYFAGRCDANRAAAVLAGLARNSDPRPRTRKNPIRWAAAAALLLALGGGLAYVRQGPGTGPDVAVPTPLCAVVAGRVLVNGAEGDHIPEGAEVEVVGDQPALIRLADGSLAELAPATRAVLRGGPGWGRQVIQLATGGGEFQVVEGPGHLLVDTPVGRVSARGTEFAVELQATEKDEEQPMMARMAMALVVAVMTGNAEVQYGNRNYEVGSGENKVYSGSHPAPAGKPKLSGKVVAVAGDGGSITLELPPANKKDPAVRRTLRITEATKLSYVNVPLKGQHPTVGYLARAWLDEGSPDTAEAVAFSGARTETAKPDLVGRVTAVAPGGKEVTLELPPAKKGEPARSATVKIREKTKVHYATVPLDGEKPTVGYTATVWLLDGSPDTASAITFSSKKDAVPKPDLTGRVTAVVAEKKEITLEVPPAKKGEPARSATVKIQDRTKMVFPGGGRNKPEVGLLASVWLEKGSRDQAQAIKFSEVRDAAKPAAPRDELSKLPGLFSLPPDLELTAEQKQKVKAVYDELSPKFQAIHKQREVVLSADQKAALALAQKAVKEAGLNDRRQIQEALEAAVNASPEQKELVQSLNRQERELRQEYLGKVDKLLTDAQRARLTRKNDGKPR